jgi:hypothetical protein
VERGLARRMMPAQRNERKSITALHSNALVARIRGEGGKRGGIHSQWATKASSCRQRRGAKLEPLPPSLPSRLATTAIVEAAMATVSIVRQTRATLTHESPGVGERVVSRW